MRSWMRTTTPTAGMGGRSEVFGEGTARKDEGFGAFSRPPPPNQRSCA